MVKAMFGLLAVLVVLAPAAEAGRSMLNLQGHLNGVAFSDAAYYYYTNGNGTWSQAMSRAASIAADYVGVGNTMGILPGGVLKPVGITSVTFPSKALGVAVGAAIGAGPSGGRILGTLGTNNLAAQSQFASAFTAYATTSSSAIPSILLSFDGAKSWAQATGIPAKSTITTPDLKKVYCASKLLCWAVGGIYGAATTGGNGAVLLATSGPGAWTYTLCPGTTAVWTPAGPVAGTTPVGTAPTPTTPYPTDYCGAAAYLPSGAPQNDLGLLMDVQSDSSGMHVYSVGLGIANNNAPILYSGNGGVTWVFQTSPAIATLTYDLAAVAVATGKIAFAAGGNLRSTAVYSAGGSLSNGIILMTTNGGFSWQQQNIQTNYTGVGNPPVGGGLQSIATANAMAFLGMAFNRNHNVNSAIWAVGVYNRASSLAATATTPATQPYTIFVATMPQGVSMPNMTTSFVQVPAAAFPNSFIGLTGVGASNDLYGIIWDNTNHGWIFGNRVIMVTYNAGLTWQYETPNALIVNVAVQPTPVQPTAIITMANVPSAY
jgi:hypothetical protein